MRENVYVLVKGDELIEVIPGREDKRDKLIAAGYEWANRRKKPKRKKNQRARGKPLDVVEISPIFEVEDIEEDADN